MKIKNDVLAVLSRSTTDGIKLCLPTGQLERKMYMDVNKVLEAAGGKWSRKEKAHVFESEAFDRLDQILLTGEVEIPKDEFNYFPSPPAVVARLIELADITHGMQVLEPSAGRGAIAFACAERGANVDCVELMESNYDALCADDRLKRVKRGCFLEHGVIEAYDRIVMNPPFAKQADIKHVTHALKFLKSDGLLVSVMSAGVMFRENKLTVELRELIQKRGGRIEALPDGSFKESGTMVKTIIVEIPAA
jgi:predicted RNA methylase